MSNAGIRIQPCHHGDISLELTLRFMGRHECDPFEESNEGLSIEGGATLGSWRWCIQKGEVQVIVSIDFHNVLDEPLDVRTRIGIDERACIPGLDEHRASLNRWECCLTSSDGLVSLWGE